MIKANELRIGNYVGFKTNETGVVTDILGVGIYFDKGEKYKGCLVLEQFKPIPITEEWLLKFGDFYKSIGNSYRVQITDNSVLSVWFLDNISIEIGDDVVLYNIKYVHQLQNLYFALTNEELTLKN